MVQITGSTDCSLLYRSRNDALRNAVQSRPATSRGRSKRSESEQCYLGTGGSDYKFILQQFRDRNSSKITVVLFLPISRFQATNYKSRRRREFFSVPLLFHRMMTQNICMEISYVLRSLPSKETLRGHSDSSFRGEGYIQCCVGVRLCDMYSNQELAEIHFIYGKADSNAALARRLYQERYPQRQCPERKTFVRLHYRLCEYGKFNSPGLGRGRPRSTTPEVQEEILEAVNMTPLSAHEG
ncbi:hypothetical protein ANN_15465 [Periplaneta americana]|uniref:DUF4817 domain-containing protein n=1 Tax=Periplaneta americana TaxID=6978 RepID=A0ABQ8SGV9_PERAM|nr:hypothetical protein ANN_15465 [Periplaneta americana]